MRASSIALVTVALAIAACTKDATGPAAADPGQALLAQKSGGQNISASSSHDQGKAEKDDHDNKKAGHDDEDRNKCGDKVDNNGNHDGQGDEHWGKRGGDDGDRGECCEEDHDRGKDGHDHHDGDGHDKDGHGHDKDRDGHHNDQDKDDDCKGAGGTTVTGTISGTVSTNLTPVGGYVVYLLNASGPTPTPIPSATTDAAGLYSFTVAPGAYLVCEADPFPVLESLPSIAGGVPSSPNAAPCSSPYAAFGFSVTVPATGGTFGGNNFFNGYAGI